MDINQIPPEIRGFIDNLIREAGITPIDEAMNEEIVLEIYSRLDNFITTAIIENMPPQHIDEFIKLNEENRPQPEIEQFIREKMPNSREVFAKALIDFRDIYLGNVVVTEEQNNSGETTDTNPSSGTNN